MPEREQGFNDRFQVPTLDEILQLVRRKSAEQRRTIGVYPETKHPTYHQKLGLPLEDRLLEVLSRHGYNHRGAPVFIQSFEATNLKYLRSRTQLNLVQLIDGNDVSNDGVVSSGKPYDFALAGDARSYKDMLTPAGLAEIAKYANGIGPWKPYLISSKCIKPDAAANKCQDTNGDGLVNEQDRALLPPSTVVADAKKLGLLVHPFTHRNEQRRLASDYKGNPVNELLAFYELGVDGMFSDFTDTARAARYTYVLKKYPELMPCLTGLSLGADFERCRALHGRE